MGVSERFFLNETKDANLFEPLAGVVLPQIVDQAVINVGDLGYVKLVDLAVVKFKVQLLPPPKRLVALQRSLQRIGSTIIKNTPSNTYISKSSGAEISKDGGNKATHTL